MQLNAHRSTHNESDSHGAKIVKQTRKSTSFPMAYDGEGISALFHDFN